MYQLDANAAREAENFSSFLSESGKYKGKFIRAEKLVSKDKGTHGIGFTFETDAKQTTRFDIWTMRADDTHLSGFKTINAIMACMKLRNLTIGKAQVDRWNWDTQKNDQVQAEVFQELTGKPIGLVMQKTEYEKMKDRLPTGEYAWRLELVAPFEAATEFTAAEIMDRATEPKKLASILSNLQDRPLKNKSAPKQQSSGYGNPAPQGASSGFDDMDDCPF